MKDGDQLELGWTAADTEPAPPPAAPLSVALPPPLVLDTLRRRERAEEAHALYLEALTLDEHAHTVARAEALYQKAIRLNPAHASAYVHLGNIYFRRSEHWRARAHYERALSIAPGLPAAMFNLGHVAFATDNFALAIDYCRRLIAALPEGDLTRADAHFILALSADRLKNVLLARVHYTRYLKIVPDGPDADEARANLKKLGA